MRQASVVHLVTQFLLVLLVSQTNIYGQQQLDRDYDNPVGAAEDDEIKSLPGLSDAINFRQYSGYLQADEKGKRFLHYWFVESQNNPSEDPVVLWLNGGPGCSSLDGLFTELGPFQVNDDGKTLKLNEFSWNKLANVLFLESPAVVGYSLTKGDYEYYDDDSTAQENYSSLKEFFKRFPKFRGNPLFLTGESYAGVYLPTLGVLVDADPELNLKGIAIGNGYLDVSKLADSLIYFSYYHGLAGKSAWDEISRSCCNNRPPAPENCHLNKTEAHCSIAVNDVLIWQYDGINPYNIYADCAGQFGGNQKALHRSFGHISREQIDRRLLKSALNRPLHSSQGSSLRLFETKHLSLPDFLDSYVPCEDESTLADYLNQPNVRNAIHVPKVIEDWAVCREIPYEIQYPMMEGGLAPQIKSLISSKRNLTLLVYNGDIDSICNFLGDEWFVDDLGRKLLVDYHIWKTDDQIAGWVKHYDGITYATVRGAGHMVPGDKPAEALRMIKVFLNSTGHNVKL